MRDAEVEVIAPLLDYLSARNDVRLLAWDAPGYGESSLLRQPSPTAADYAHALAAMLDEVKRDLSSSEASVTRPAEKLHLTQPTVSGQIKELEAILGFLLFHRTSRRVTLSEQGARLLPKVEALLELADEVRHDAEDMQHATVTQFRLGAAHLAGDDSVQEILEARGVTVEVAP